MARNRDFGWLSVVLILVMSLVLNIVPLPDLVAPLRPDFVALGVLWLCLLAARPTGLGVAFAAGLAQDALQGIVLGQHALALAVVAYIALKMRLRIRAFPLLHQSGVVFALLWVGEFILFWIDGVAGYPATEWTRWMGVLVGAAAWPFVNGLYARIAARA